MEGRKDHKMIKVYVLDDHPIVVRGMRLILSKEADMELAGEAASYKELKGLLRRGVPDVLVLDMTLPDCDGLDVLKDMKVLYPELPVMIMSMHSEEELAIRCFRDGASGYLNKSKVADELVTAIRTLAEGGRYITGRVAGLMASTIDKSNVEQAHELLSDREFQVLKGIARGMKINEIAEALSVSESTVRTYHERVLRKMYMRNDAELTYYAVKHGLVE